MDLGLDGKRVLVTGGAGGIGAAISRGFAAEGAEVVVHFHSSDTEAGVLAAELGGVAIGADLTDETDVGRLFASAIDALGGVDVCVANAGWYPRDDVPVWELGLDRWREVVDRNLTTAFLTARSFLSHAAQTGRGVLVFTGSTAGLFGEAGHADYAAAKAAIGSGFLLSLKNEAARIGDDVRVNVVAPGWTVTPRRAAEGLDPDHVARATSTMARKQLATPEEVAHQVLVLASDTVSSHQTGQVVVVAGGMEGRVTP
ncbi:MAG: SDR family oxidoreductase [Acidimicrobiia bacterium]|nr:SDR family oxidoreductase [Acidimicrobiia bacterium]